MPRQPWKALGLLLRPSPVDPARVPYSLLRLRYSYVRLCSLLRDTMRKGMRTGWSCRRCRSSMAPPSRTSVKQTRSCYVPEGRRPSSPARVACPQRWRWWPSSPMSGTSSEAELAHGQTGWLAHGRTDGTELGRAGRHGQWSSRGGRQSSVAQGGMDDGALAEAGGARSRGEERTAKLARRSAELDCAGRHGRRSSRGGQRSSIARGGTDGGARSRRAARTTELLRRLSELDRARRNGRRSSRRGRRSLVAWGGTDGEARTGQEGRQSSVARGFTDGGGRAEAGAARMEAGGGACGGWRRSHGG